ncbi:MAG TPA: BamA/TamA family outer membrane protein [Candidatus Cloacimonadota bacterium]|nr:BamA/TamA family outer membrane protein [Candidatus Cloacimonadota bacterium]
MSRILVCLILLAAVTLPIFGQNSFTAYPYVAYSGDTKLMVGAFGFFRHDLETTSVEPEVFSILTNTIYSVKHQFLFVLMPQYRTENWKIAASMIFQEWSDAYHGIGNSSDMDEGEDYTSRRYSIETQITRNLSAHLKLSMRALQGWHKVRDYEENGLMQNAQLLGFDPGFYSGLGYAIGYDSTEDNYYPERGVKLEFKQLFFDEAWGSDYDYSESQYDLRAYLKTSGVSVLALQSDLVHHGEDLPFYNYPELGARLRAYDARRYIDKARISQRIENRIFPFSGSFTRRIGFVAFAESGQVAADVRDIRLKDWHYSVGGGLRFSILPNEKLNLRADIGFGDNSTNFMVNAREVF